jgi:hypothetical protein
VGRRGSLLVKMISTCLRCAERLGGGGVSTLCARMARGCADNMKVQEATSVTPLIREPVTHPMRDGTERQRRGGVWRGGGGQTMQEYAIHIQYDDLRNC